MSLAQSDWRPWAAISLFVIGAHVLALQPSLVQLRMSDAAAVPSMRVRTIDEVPVMHAPVLQERLAEPSPRETATATATATRRTATIVAPTQAATPSPAVEPHATSPLVAIAVPASTRIHYAVTFSIKGATHEGNADLTWQHDGENYAARFEADSPRGPRRVQTSVGRITATGIAPQRFSDRYRSEQATHFEHEKGQLVFSANSAPVDLEMGTQDRLSVMLQLASLIAGNPAKYTSGGTVEINTAGTREAQAWRFTIDGEETLALPAGNMRALKLTRALRGEYDARMEVWLAPGMAYGPVRLRLTTSGGDWTDQQWSGTDTP